VTTPPDRFCEWNLRLEYGSDIEDGEDFDCHPRAGGLVIGGDSFFTPNVKQLATLTVQHAVVTDHAMEAWYHPSIA
jgi:hypothetical protein